MHEQGCSFITGQIMNIVNKIAVISALAIGFTILIVLLTLKFTVHMIYPAKPVLE